MDENSIIDTSEPDSEAKMEEFLKEEFARKVTYKKARIRSPKFSNSKFFQPKPKKKDDFEKIKIG